MKSRGLALGESLHWMGMAPQTVDAVMSGGQACMLAVALARPKPSLGAACGIRAPFGLEGPAR